MKAPFKMNPLYSLLRKMIAEQGGLSFDAYMSECLYHPQYGYYMTGRKRIGKSGDFFTSSSVHSLFGRLLARQLIEMAKILDDRFFEVVEQGPGEGHLALDILDAISTEAPEVYARLQYRLLEMSPEHRRRQAETLDSHNSKVEWCGEEWKITSGCFLSNELIDAFPVHLVEKHNGQLKEVFVVNAEGGFAEELRQPSSPKIAQHLAWLGTSPVEGNRAEINLVGPDWMRQIGKRLERGFVVTIDYGYPTEELYAPHRRTGTLMCYHRHQADDNPYEKPGEKDLTAHVDFSALQRAGEEVDLNTLWFGEQYRFLMGLGFCEELIHLEARANNENEARALRLTLKNLVVPETGMGETFKVLIQGKGVQASNLLCSRQIRDIPVGGELFR